MKSNTTLHIALLTGGGDRPYALGLAQALKEQQITTDFIGSDDLDDPSLHGCRFIRFLNLRGKQSGKANTIQKFLRVLAYYWRLLCYAFVARPKIFHILWHNKFEFFDRTVLMGFYKLLGKRLVFTAHNVNAGKRDGNDSVWNQISLRSQYRLSDHIFVHTELMKLELEKEFKVDGEKVTVIPFGINNTLPTTDLSSAEARKRLGLTDSEKVVLFFGNITAYKGLEYLVDALIPMIAEDRTYRLVIAGRTKGAESYWERIWKRISEAGVADRVLTRVEFIPDNEVEVFFKAADVLVLPYTEIFQSGVLFLGYSFGLPVIATDVGELRDSIVENRTGYVCKPKSVVSLAECIDAYFSSDLCRELASRRSDIIDFANKKYSWTRVGKMTEGVYRRLQVKNSN